MITGAQLFVKALKAENELAYLRITGCGSEDPYSLPDIMTRFGLQILDAEANSILLQSVNSFERTNELIDELAKSKYTVEVVRSGSVAI